MNRLKELRNAFRKNRANLTKDELYEFIEQLLSISMKVEETDSLVIDLMSDIYSKKIDRLENENKRLENQLTPEQNMIQ